MPTDPQKLLSQLRNRSESEFVVPSMRRLLGQAADALEQANTELASLREAAERVRGWIRDRLDESQYVLTHKGEYHPELIEAALSEKRTCQALATLLDPSPSDTPADHEYVPAHTSMTYFEECATCGEAKADHFSTPAEKGSRDEDRTTFNGTQQRGTHPPKETRATSPRLHGDELRRIQTEGRCRRDHAGVHVELRDAFDEGQEGMSVKVRCAFYRRADESLGPSSCLP